MLVRHRLFRTAGSARSTERRRKQFEYFENKKNVFEKMNIFNKIETFDQHNAYRWIFGAPTRWDVWLLLHFEFPFNWIHFAYLRVHTSSNNKTKESLYKRLYIFSLLRKYTITYKTQGYLKDNTHDHT